MFNELLIAWNRRNKLAPSILWEIRTTNAHILWLLLRLKFLPASLSEGAVLEGVATWWCSQVVGKLDVLLVCCVFRWFGICTKFVCLIGSCKIYWLGNVKEVTLDDESLKWAPDTKICGSELQKLLSEEQAQDYLLKLKKKFLKEMRVRRQTLRRNFSSNSLEKLLISIENLLNFVDLPTF